MEDADFSIRLHAGDPHSSAPASQCISGVPLTHASDNRGHSGRTDSRCSSTAHDAPSVPALASRMQPHAFAQSTAGSEIASDRISGSSVSGKRRRRRIRHVVYRSNVTSGRRMVQWGPFKTTFLHFKFGLMWYFGCSAEQLQEAYNKLYTDAYR